MWNFKKQKSHRKKIRPVVTRGGVWGEGELEEGGQKVKLPVIRY